MEELAEPQHEEDVIHSQGDSNDPSEYTPLSVPDDSNSEPEPIRAASEFRSYGEESPTVPAQLHGLLFQLDITRATEYKFKSVPRPGRIEFTRTVEVINGQEVVSKHACPAPRVTCAEAVAEAAWLVLMSCNRSRHRDLKNSIYTLYPQRYKDAFKISQVDPQIFRGAMSHTTSLSLALSDHLLAAQRQIHYLHTQLACTEDTLRAR
jgi:predicted nucleic acid-binding protein